MQQINLPKYVQTVLKRLESAGFSAYAVGGCVRDMLMGRRPQDWDVCSSAKPDDIIRLFSHTIPTGIAHGTVTVIIHGSFVEVTTFRRDGKYSDHRRPENVSFIADLYGDLKRRDFTMNAMALSLSGELIDPFGGQNDIENRLIRCVGQPETRFGEDALRMLRALRFSAVLSFEIENSTLSAIKSCAPLSSALASERVCTELRKTLMSNSPETVGDFIAFGLLEQFTLCCYPLFDLSPIKRLPKKALLRWAGLCALLKNGGIILECKDFLLSLRLSRETIAAVSSGCLLAFELSPESRLEWKRLLSQYGESTARCCAAAVFVLTGKNYFAVIDDILRSGEAIKLKDLALSGDDLISLGYKGHSVGSALSRLLNHVLEFPRDNSRDKLLSILGNQTN